MPASLLKDPDAVLDYQFDWAAWLADSETITSHTVTVPTGITLDSSTDDGSTVTAWLSGGEAGTSYDVVCHVTTDQGREDDRTLHVNVRQR